VSSGVLWDLYVHNKQTYQELASKYGKSTRWIQQKLDKHMISNRQIAPQNTSLVIDTIYFGRKFGIIVFRSPTLKKNLVWYVVKKESVEDYEKGIGVLISAGFRITGATVDGKPGVLKQLQQLGLPVQMCQFHMQQIVTRYTTRRPKLPAGRELREIALRITRTDQASFEYWLNQWHTKWKNFLNEKSWDEEERRWWFTHKRLRQAYRSLVKHLPYLFIYHHYPDMPNTTNSLDGSFSHLRDKLRLHRGLRWDRKLKVIYELLGK